MIDVQDWTYASPTDDTFKVGVLLQQSEEPTLAERLTYEAVLRLPPEERATGAIEIQWPFPLLSSPRAPKFYRDQMDNTQHRGWFGWIDRKNKNPMHVNTRDDPLPVITTNGFRKRRSFGPKLAGQHLSATKANMQAVFHLSRPDAKVVLLGQTSMSTKMLFDQTWLRRSSLRSIGSLGSERSVNHPEIDMVAMPG